MAFVGLYAERLSFAFADDFRFARANNSFKGIKGLSRSGNTITIAPGYMLSHGRLTRVVSNEEVLAPTVTSGTTFCRLVYEVDLSLTNTESSFVQGYFTVLTNNSAYPTLTQQDLDDGGTKYDIPFARFKVTSAGVSDFVDERRVFGTVTEVSVPASGWTSTSPYTQTVSVTNVLATDAPVQAIVYPASCTAAQRKAMQKAAGLICKIETADGSITFTATSKPATDLTIGLYL